MTTYMCDDGNAELEVDAESASEAAREYVDGGDWGDSSRSCWVAVYVWTLCEHEAASGECEVAGCDGGDERESHMVEIAPLVPDCAPGVEHDWVSPHWLLGGLEENPGVSGHGGGVIATEACRHCGCERVTDTWAQSPETGEEGLTSVEYEAAKYADDFCARGGEYVRSHEWETGEAVDLADYGLLYRAGAVDAWAGLGYDVRLDADGRGAVESVESVEATHG